MTVLLTILFVITALLLIGVVLIQQPKTSGGLFSGTGQSLLGTSGKTFWTKFTTILASVFMLLCLLLGLMPKEGPKSLADVIEKQQQAAQPTISVPAVSSPVVPVAEHPAPQSAVPQKAPASAQPTKTGSK
jgi:preprotein translocase subunit SecG